MNNEHISKLIIRISKFFIPFILAIIGIVIIYLVVDIEYSGKLFLLMFAYFFPPLGKESIIPIGVSGGELILPIYNNQIIVPSINPLIMALTIAFVDIIVALFLVWNYDLAKKIPLIGNFIIKVEKIGKKSSNKYSWIKPLKFIGIILFVMVPFQGSGGLVGSIVGRLVGMKPWNIFFAISIGAIFGCLMISYFAEIILSVIVRNFLLGFLLILIFSIILLMIFAYRKSFNNQKKHGNK
jgi:uncharacterized membrane protein